MEGRKDVHLAGVLHTGLRPRRVGKSRLKVALLKVIQCQCLLGSETHNSRRMLNVGAQMSLREPCERG